MRCKPLSSSLRFINIWLLVCHKEHCHLRIPAGVRAPLQNLDSGQAQGLRGWLLGFRLTSSSHFLRPVRSGLGWCTMGTGVRWLMASLRLPGAPFSYCNSPLKMTAGHMHFAEDLGGSLGCISLQVGDGEGVWTTPTLHYIREGYICMFSHPQ